MVEKGRNGRKIVLFQPSKSPKIREKSRQNSPKPRQNDGKTAAKHRRRASFKVSRAGGTGDSLSPIRPGAGRAAGCDLSSVQRRRAAASSARRGLSGAICPAGRGAAALSYIAMYGAAGRDLLPARASSARRGAAAGRGLSSGGGRRARSPTGAASSSRHGKAAHGKRPTEKGNKKEVGAAAGRVYLFFRVILPGRSFFRGVVRCGRLESIAGHSFPRGRQNVSLHTFARLSGGGFYFFRVRFRRFQIYLCAFC